MAAAVAMRLMPAALVPRAVSVIFSGIAVATIVAVPLTLPRMAPHGTARRGTLWEVLRRPGFGWAS